MSYNYDDYDVLRDTPVAIPVLIHVDKATGEVMKSGGEGVASYVAAVRCQWGLDDAGQVTTKSPKVALASAYQQAPKLKKDGTPRKVGPKWHWAEGSVPSYGVPADGAWIIGSKISPRFALGKAGRALLAGSLAAHDRVSKAHAKNPAHMSEVLTAQIGAVWAELQAKVSKAS